MDNQKATEAIEKVLDHSKVGVLSTAYNNKPNSRYMVFYNDELTLYTKTNVNSIKVEEIEEDLLPEVENRVENEFNFKILDHRLTFHGVCSECQAKNKQ